MSYQSHYYSGYSWSLFCFLLITEGVQRRLQRNSSLTFRKHLLGIPTIFEKNLSFWTLAICGHNFHDTLDRFVKSNNDKVLRFVLLWSTLYFSFFWQSHSVDRAFKIWTFFTIRPWMLYDKTAEEIHITIPYPPLELWSNSRGRELK